MSNMSAIRVAVGAWLSTLVGAMITMLTAAVLPSWVAVGIDVGGVFEEADIGLWQTCRPGEFFYNCTTLNSVSTTGRS